MAVFPEEQQGRGRRDAAKKRPADLLARSGLPVPVLGDDIGGFNADFRRLVARISKLFSIVAPTVQGQAESAETTQLAAHHTQHESGGGDEINVTGLPGVLAQDQVPQTHDLVGAKHSVSGLTAGHVLRATGSSTYDFGAIQDADIPASIARDSELSAYGSRSLGITVFGDEVASGVKGFVRVPFSGTIERWTVMADVSGSVVFDIWKDSFGNFPPLVGDSIVGAGNKPTLTSEQAASATLSGWSVSTVTAGDVLAFNIDSAAGIGRVTLVLDVQI